MSLNNKNSVRSGSSNFSNRKQSNSRNMHGLEVIKIPEQKETNQSILVVAFDGLDYELIQEFDLQNILQEEFGKIENTTGMTERMTSELFTSFITGRTHEEHGVEGLMKSETPIQTKLKNNVVSNLLTGNIRGFDFLQRHFLNEEKRKYHREDIQSTTLFEELDDSRAMFIPGYNPSILWATTGFGKPLELGYTQSDILEMWDEREYEYRKRKLFSELENDLIPARSFLMCHFHRADTHQHFFDGHHKNSDIKSQSYDRNHLKQVYQELDELAGEIKEKALEKGYSHVVFMSDHGMPEGTQHNKNAFYSCNKELFWDYTPKITDFYLKILDLNDQTDRELKERQLEKANEKYEKIHGKTVTQNTFNFSNKEKRVAEKLD